MADHRSLLDAAMREHLPTFVHLAFQISSPGERFLSNWHVDAICHALMRVMSGETKRLIIEMPPRSLKSTCVSIAFVAFLLGHRPTQKIICASYSGELAAQLSRACREVMRHPIYRRLFPDVEITRFATASPLIEQGRLHLPRRAEWLGELKNELLQFPNGRHDDQVDALSQFLIWVGHKETRRCVAEHRGMFEPPKKPARSWNWDGTTFFI